MRRCHPLLQARVNWGCSGWVYRQYTNDDWLIFSAAVVLVLPVIVILFGFELCGL